MRPPLVTKRQWFKYNMYLIMEHFIGLKNSEKYLRPKKNRLYAEIAQNPGMESRGKSFPDSSFEKTNFNPAEADKETLLNNIYVFRKQAKDWDCVKNWSKEFFKNNYGQTNISLIDNPGLVDKDKENKFKTLSFAEYLDEVEKDKSKYLRFSRIIDNNPELLNDLDTKWLRSFKWGLCNGEQTFLFMGENGTRTPVHAGLTHTIFIQIKGKKKWTIYRPNERVFLDAIADRVLYFYTHANPDKVDVERYPLLNHAEKYEIILDEGDVLWLPSFYWHQVENIGEAIGVAFKYTNLPQSFKLSKAMLSLFFMATKPSILKSFIYNRFNKQDYIFNKDSSEHKKIY